jgi:RNA polymerase sigma-70 factor (ECF subfamily)
MAGVPDIRLAFADGSSESFLSVYESTKTRLHAYAIRLAGERDLAADAVQESYVRLYQNAGTITSPAVVASWLFSTARNFLLNHQRLERRFAPAEEDPTAMADPAPEPYEAEDQRAYLRRLVDALGPLHREAILLREYEGMSYGEIAKVTGVPVSTVKMRLFKARKALAERFEKRGR